jgi:hypothetical protein
MDQALRQFQVEGLAAGVRAWDHRVILTLDETTTPPTTRVLSGVQTAVEVDPEQLQEFGYHVHRVFSLAVNDPAILSIVKVGMRGVDQNGDPCRLVHFKRDVIGVKLFFGSVNR